MKVRVGEMSVAELRELLDDLLEEKLLVFLGDPEAGLAVRPEVMEQILAQMESVREGEYGIPLSELQD